MRKAIFLFLPAVAALAQQNPPDARDLVQVGVLAQDQNRKAIADLRREDFQIFDNGVRQEITQFLANKPGAAPQLASPAGVFTNRPATDSGAGYSVVYFDNFQTAHAEQSFLALKAIPPGEKVAIYANDPCPPAFFRELTSGWDSLIPKLDAVVRKRQMQTRSVSRSSSDWSVEDCLNGEPPAEHAITQKIQEFPDISVLPGLIDNPWPSHGSDDPVDVADKKMQLLAVRLAQIPGRKSLIWVATNFRLNKSNRQRLLNANVAIYPVDAIGAANATAKDKELRAAALLSLAAMSGGKAYVDRDDPDVAIGEALSDGQVSYTLGFRRTGAGRNADGDRIEVRTRHEGPVLRYRTTWSAAPEDRTPVPGLVDSVDRPVTPPAVPMTLAPARHGNQLDLALTLDVSTLGLQQKKNGVWEGKVKLYSYFGTIEGRGLGKRGPGVMDFHLPPALYAAALQNGFVFRTTMAIPPKAAKLYLETHSEASGKSGVLRIPLSEVKSVAAPEKKQADSPGAD